MLEVCSNMKTEQEKHSEFEAACGGPTKAFRLMRIWESCPNSSNLLYPNPKDAPKSYGVKNRVQIFTDKAKREGYTQKQISLYLDL